jgi:hypothetical protein
MKTLQQGKIIRLIVLHPIANARADAKSRKKFSQLFVRKKTSGRSSGT